MKALSRSCIAAGLAGLALAACQPVQQVSDMPAAAAQPTHQTTATSSAAVPSAMRITTEQQFKEKVVGKKLTSKNGYSIAHEDGTLTGAFGKGGKDKLTGTWQWEEQYFCRTATVGKREFGYDCNVVEASGDMLTFTREKGKGKSTQWRIEPGS